MILVYSLFYEVLLYHTNAPLAHAAYSQLDRGLVNQVCSTS